MADTRLSKTQSIEAGAALVLLGVVLLLLVLPWNSLPTFYAGWARYLELHPDFSTAVMGAFFFNFTLIAALLSRSLATHKKTDLKELKASTQKPDRGIGIDLVIALILGGAIFALLSFYYILKEIEAIPFLSSVSQKIWVERFIRSNFALSFSLLSFLMTRGIRSISLLKKLGRSVPKLPPLKNAIAIGTIGEESETDPIRWVILGQKALNGNVLITGSIGSGKTQGTLLPFLDQILTNFKPLPSILAIDPKSRFIERALKMLKKHGHMEHVLHITLDGAVTFNPIFQEKPLKNARFQAIAQMVRAAAVNFMGKSTDSSFWETSSFNLIKNCLIYCAAVHHYYTLNDLYTAMVRSVSAGEEFTEELELTLDNPNFDEEERFNIQKALEYFQREYQQLEDKVRTGILATSTSFLNQFQEYRASRIFCPTQEGLTIKNMDEMIDNGKILLFDVSNPGLARSMGTFIKLHYEQSLLHRYSQPERNQERSGILIVDEYQDVVTSGTGAGIGDDQFLAEGREANAITIVATQSLSSLETTLGREKPTQAIFQNFKTKILGNSSDLATIRAFQELAGKQEKKRISRSVSEQLPHASRNMFLGGYESKDTNVSESMSTSDHEEYSVTGREFSRLNSFEAFAQIYDGVSTDFRKIFLKPFFLEKKNTPHAKILKTLKASLVASLALAFFSSDLHAFPNVCTVLKSSEARSCLNFQVGVCMCGWPVPRPCANFSYYVPETFVEVMPEPRSSYFGALPGAAVQLATLGESPYGAESDEDTHSFQSHTLTVPLLTIPYALLPCGITSFERTCFESMSEHLGKNWDTGSADLLQPKFLAWSASPKACLAAGAASSLAGTPEAVFSPAVPSCSVPLSFLPVYPPSSHSACNGWGTFYPRYSTYTGGSQTAGALMVGSRMKSLASEVFHTTGSSPDEFWQMIFPQSSSCFREGQNVGVLETVKNVRETERLVNGKMKGYLFTVWHKVSCCRDLAFVPEAYAAIEAAMAVCQGLGGL